jgi:hypothetical protein
MRAGGPLTSSWSKSFSVIVMASFWGCRQQGQVQTGKRSSREAPRQILGQLRHLHGGCEGGGNVQLPPCRFAVWKVIIWCAAGTQASAGSSPGESLALCGAPP